MSGPGPWRWGALAATLAPILVLTLVPGPSTAAEPISIWCVVCGWRGTSDAILNIALFVPFGLALGALGRTARTALIVGLTVSLGIEVTQAFIPNRMPGLGDVLYNSLGASLGVLLYTQRGRLWPSDRAAARRRTFVWCGIGLALLVGQAWLLSPALPLETDGLEWTPVTRYGLQYEGRVLRFREAGQDLSAGELSAGVLARIARGTRIEIDVVAGPTPGGIVPIVRIRRGLEDVFAIELDHRDIVVSYRTRGMVGRLDRPLARWDRGTSTWIRGDTITLGLRAVGDGMVIEQTGGTGTSPNPDYDPGPVELSVPTGRGWAFLMYPRLAARIPGNSIDFLWMLVLALPLGLWGSTRAALLSGAAWIGALHALPAVFPLVASSHPGTLGVAIGVPLGLLLHLVHGNPEPFRWWKPLTTLFETDET